MSDTADLAALLGALPPRGAYPCTSCRERCDDAIASGQAPTPVATVELPGDCDACADVERQELVRAHEKLMRPARESVPERFRWARPSHSEWSRRVSERLRGALEQLASIPKLGFTIVGESGDGKTSAACSILHAIHDRATFNAEAHRVERARRAYFVSEPELEREIRESRLGTVTPNMARARSASVLVLDDVGQTGRRCPDVVGLVQDRSNHERCTIVTTALDRDALARLYASDGFARRVFEDVKVIRCRPVAVRLAEAG